MAQESVCSCVVEDGKGAVGSVHYMCHGHQVCAKSPFTKEGNYSFTI